MSEETFEIPAASIEYQTHDGYIRHWLVAGPLATPVPDLERYPGADFKEQIARAYYLPDLEIAQPPAERATVALVNAAQPSHLRWEVVHCDDDRFVDVSRFHHTCHHLRTWAYCQLEAPVGGSFGFVLTTNGPADVWINGQHVARTLHFHHQIPHSTPLAATLDAGRNEIMVRFEAVAVRECPYVMALQITAPELAHAPVILPTHVEPVARRQKLEEAMAHAYLPKAVYYRDELLKLMWADAMAYRGQLAVRLQSLAGRIYAEGQPSVEAGAATSFGAVYQVPSGDYHLTLMPLPEEYYIHDMRVQRRLSLRISNDRYAEQPVDDTYEQRSRAALEDAARRGANVFAEIAKMALERWSAVKPDVIQQCIDDINRRADCSDFYLVGLLGMMARFLDDPGFPDGLRQPLEECVLGFRYWMDEPGDDAMCFWSENHQILFHTCAVLAGQLYPDRVFSNTGELGRWHRAKGERMALSWLRKRGTGGFREWDSNCYFEEDVLALSHLADLAADVEVAEMAAVVLDKLFFTMAVNSFRGVFGSTHGRTYTPYILSGRQEPTSGLSRLAFGAGCFNDRILGTVGLACAHGYELPPLIAAIAADAPDELWSRERHAGVLEEWCDRATGAWEVSKVTYRTPDYMLASAQDYQAGGQGYQQHIWQATLGPSAVVFVTHPPCVSEDGSHRPNFWHGNVILPRVAQWKDVLIAVHRFAADDWMGFTHAYFPAAEFDEVEIGGGWACARQGDGYLALTAARGLQQTTRGQRAYQELRSYGCENVWLCQMGRAAHDGSFGQFVAKVLALDVRFGNLGVEMESLRGQRIEFGWEGPLWVDGAVQPLGGFKHYDSPYCAADLPASHMEIRHQDKAMRLAFTGSAETNS